MWAVHIPIVVVAALSGCSSRVEASSGELGDRIPELTEAVRRADDEQARLGATLRRNSSKAGVEA